MKQKEGKSGTLFPRFPTFSLSFSLSRPAPCQLIEFSSVNDTYFGALASVCVVMFHCALSLSHRRAGLCKCVWHEIMVCRLEHKKKRKENRSIPSIQAANLKPPFLANAIPTIPPHPRFASDPMVVVDNLITWPEIPSIIRPGVRGNPRCAALRGENRPSATA